MLTLAAFVLCHFRYLINNKINITIIPYVTNPDIITNANI